MRQFPCFLLALALLPAAARSQDLPSAPQPTSASDDADEEAWDRLTFIRPESQLAVQTRRGTFHCQDQRVSDAVFYCETPAVSVHWFVVLDSRSLKFQRSEVFAVRERHPGRIRLVGYGSALGAGFAVGAANANTKGGEPRVIGGLAGSALFGLAALPVVEAIAAFSPGKLLYRRLQHPPTPKPE